MKTVWCQIADITAVECYNEAVDMEISIHRSRLGRFAGARLPPYWGIRMLRFMLQWHLILDMM